MTSIPATVVYLTDEQVEALQKRRSEIVAAADAGRPGFLAAQIFVDKMFVFFIDHERALKFQELMGQTVGEVGTGAAVLTRAREDLR